MAVDGAANPPRFREDVALLVLTFVVITVGLFLRLFFLTGVVGSDDLRYFFFSRELLTSFKFSLANHAAGRLATLVFVGFPGVILGNLVFCAIANVVYATLTDILVTAFAYSRIGPRAGLATAIFLAFAALPLLHAGTFSPDTLLTLFMASAAISVFLALEKTPASWRRMAAAGVLSGLAYSAKDTGILLLPPVFLYLALAPSHLSLPVRAKLFSFYMAGFLFIWLAESLAYAYIAGDFFFKQTVLAMGHNAQMHASTSMYDFLRRVWWNATIIFREWNFLLVPLLLSLPAWALTLAKHRRFWLFAFVGIFVTAYLVAGTSSLTRLINLPFQGRYLQPVLPFGAISLGLFWDRYMHGGAVYKVSTGVLATVLFVIGVASAGSRAGAIEFAEPLRAAALSLRVLPADGKSLFVDTRTYLGLKHLVSARDLSRVRVLDRPATLMLPGYHRFIGRDRSRVTISNWTDKPLRPGYYFFYRSRGKGELSYMDSLIDRSALILVRRFQMDTRNIRMYYPVSGTGQYTIEIYEKK